MKYCPPLIFAHRCFVERIDKPLLNKEISNQFDEKQKFGGDPLYVGRWIQGLISSSELIRMGIEDRCTGLYYGFRTSDDQMLFYLTFGGRR